MLFLSNIFRTGSFLCISLILYVCGAFDQGKLDRVASMHQYAGMFGMEDVFFEIADPPELRYSYLVQVTRFFGGQLNFTLRGARLVPSEPPFACQMPINCDDIEGAVALIERGECPFVEKVDAVERCGARAAIIHDNSRTNVEHFLEMTSDSKTVHPQIPAAFLLGNNGYMIRQTLERLQLPHAIVNMPVNASALTIDKVKQPPWVLW